MNLSSVRVKPVDAGQGEVIIGAKLVNGINKHKLKASFG